MTNRNKAAGGVWRVAMTPGGFAVLLDYAERGGLGK